LRTRTKAGLALASGMLLWLSFPNPWAMHFEAWPGYLAYIALVPLVAALETAETKEGFGLGFVAGSAFFLPGLLWLTNVKPLGLGAFPAWCGLAAWCALFVGAFGAGAAYGLRRRWPLPVLWLPALWTVLECLRAWLFTGFPWLGLGTTQAFHPRVAALAAFAGLPGLDYAVVLANGVAFALLVRPSWLLPWRRGLAVLAVIGLLAWGAGEQIHAQKLWSAGEPVGGLSPRFLNLKVGVAQGGIDEDQAWTQEYRDHLLRMYFTLTTSAVAQGARLVIWPESSFPGFFNENAPEALLVKEYARREKVYLLLGSTLSEGGAYTNSAVLVDPDGNTRSYAKRHLVPFGEYVPFRHWVGVLDLALQKMGVEDFRAGDSPADFGVADTTVAPLICYESVFPELARGPQPADVLAILTVDTWYGVSPGPVWHAAQASLRAIENGCWVARSAATGISLFAAPDGSVPMLIDLNEAGVLVHYVEQARPTPWKTYGNWFLWVCCGLLGILAVYDKMQSKTFFAFFGRHFSGE